MSHLRSIDCTSVVEKRRAKELGKVGLLRDSRSALRHALNAALDADGSPVSEAEQWETLAMLVADLEGVSRVLPEFADRVREARNARTLMLEQIYSSEREAALT